MFELDQLFKQVEGVDIWGWCVVGGGWMYYLFKVCLIWRTCSFKLFNLVPILRVDQNVLSPISSGTISQL